MRSCAAGPCSHHGAQDREVARLPRRFSCRTVLTTLPGPTSSMIDKVLLSGVPAADRGWQIPRSSWESIYKKAQKTTEYPVGHSQSFCAFIFAFIPFSQVIATLQSYSWPILFPQMTLSYHGSRSFLRTTRGRLPPCHFPSALQMLRPQMLRPKYSFSLPYGAVPVNLRFPQ